MCKNVPLQDASVPVVHPWQSKLSKMAQQDLDYVSPEIQLETTKTASPSCDIYSLGQLVCSVYNGGRSLIQAGYLPANYIRQIDKVLLGHSSSLVELHISHLDGNRLSEFYSVFTLLRATFGQCYV